MRLFSMASINIKGQGKTLNINFLIFIGPQLMSQVGLDGEQKNEDLKSHAYACTFYYPGKKYVQSRFNFFPLFKGTVSLIPVANGHRCR
jgi:hypothetical protein